MKKITSLLLCIILVVNILAMTAAASDEVPFSDVHASDWFYTAVASMYEQGIIWGTDKTTFSPDICTTRAMAVTVLYRMEGQPDAGECIFTDVPAGAYYASAVAWANESGIVYGTDSSHFSPNNYVTREQLITILYRYIQYKGSTAQQRSNLNIYQDRNAIDSYAVPAMRWAVAVGMISGRSSTSLAPLGSTRRSELAQMLYNLQTKIMDNDSVMNPETTVVPVLMFHSVHDDQQNAYSLTTENFESVISMLYEAGFHSISMQQLNDYVYADGELPDNPIMITFDDGYQNNIDNACPILEKYGFCAAISVIGCYVGLDSYNGKSITPHFSFESASQYTPSTISIESHTMKMHMLSDYPNLDDGRIGVAKRDSETAADYYQRLLTDFTDSYNLIAGSFDAPLTLTYPYGIFTVESEAAAKEVGYHITLTTRTGVNVITKDNPESLYLLNRVNISRTYTEDEFYDLLTSLYYE